MRPIADAASQGTIVTTWDSDVPDSQRRLFYGVENYKVGTILAEHIVKLIGPSGKVVLESGSLAGRADTRNQSCVHKGPQLSGVRTRKR